LIKCFNLDRRFKETSEPYFEYVQDIVNRENVFNGYYTSRVEKYLQELTGRKFVLLTNSGSNSLLITMMALGIGPGDEVIVTNYSCPASETFVKTVGATPIYCEVDDTGNMDMQYLEELVSDRTRAIVTTGLYGDMHDHASVDAFVKKYNLHYINDAAQSFFASIDGLQSYSTGKIVCMSFAENKPIPAIGTHGAILTDDNELYYKCLHLRKHGKPYRRAPYTAYGVNGVPEEDKAAQILCSTQHVEKWQSRRHEISNYYDKEFNSRGVEIRQHQTDWNTHKYAIMFHEKFDAQKQLEAEGVSSEAHYPDAFSNLPMSNKFAMQSLSIPINAHLTDAEVEHIVKAVEKVWKNNSI
jgi:UDP-2-acetamido-2-deoxy-ribo-hexuluronate aminotransferase